MEAFINSTVMVTLAEIGDKTQLLSLVLATKFRNKIGIVLGILAATLLNHAVSAWMGTWLSQYMESNISHWILAGSFIVLGLWLLIPDKDEDVSSKYDKYGAFAVSCVLFFIAEIGDKTQIATILLGAQYSSVFWVTMGTTLGMLLANVPVVYLGQHLMKIIPLNTVRILAAVAFIIAGVFHLMKYNLV